MGNNQNKNGPLNQTQKLNPNNNSSETLARLNELANKGEPEAQNILGLMYQNGVCVTKDYNLAFYWFEKSASNKHPIGMLNLGYCYQKGIGVKSDLKKAFELYLNAAQANNPVAQNLIGKIYENGGVEPQDYTKAAKWYNKAADQGYTDAELNYGYLLENGLGFKQNIPLAKDYYKRAAEKLNSTAQYHLSLLYLKESKTQNNYEKGMNLLILAAENNSIKAMLELGDIYQKGSYGQKKDIEKSNEWFKKAQEAQAELEKSTIENMYNKILIDPKELITEKRDISTSTESSPLIQPPTTSITTIANANANQANQTNKLIRSSLNKQSMTDSKINKKIHVPVKSSLRNNLDKSFNSAKDIRSVNNSVLNFSPIKRNDTSNTIEQNLIDDSNDLLPPKIQDPLEILFQNAIEGDISSCNQLAQIYEHGLGIPKNHREAFYWYKKAAEAGDNNGQFNLARMYKKGLFVKRNFNQAYFWFQKAADQGNLNALTNLGIMYEKGLGVLMNLDKAKQYYMQASDQGNKEALFNLGVLYEKEGNYSNAMEYYILSAMKNHPCSGNNIGLFYENGIGVTKNLSLAIEWYTKSAELGNIEAICNLAWMYHAGKGVDIDYIKAYNLYEIAAKQNNPRAMYNIGFMHQHGQGVPIDLSFARTWFKKAAFHGYNDAKRFLTIPRSKENIQRSLLKSNDESNISIDDRGDNNNDGDDGDDGISVNNLNTSLYNPIINKRQFDHSQRKFISQKSERNPSLPSLNQSPPKFQRLKTTSYKKHYNNTKLPLLKNHNHNGYDLRTNASMLVDKNDHSNTRIRRFSIARPTYI